ncbi:MAG: TraB/VirB10 family protein [Chlamydiales bacterium]
MIDKAKQILKTQKKHFLILFGIVIVIVLAISHFVFVDIRPSVSTPPGSLKVDLPVDHINPQNIWMNRQDDVINRIDSENKLLNQKMKYLEELILANKKKDEESQLEKIELSKIITHLKEDLKSVMEKPEQVPHQEIALVSPQEIQKTDLSKKTVPGNLFSSPQQPTYFSAPPTPNEEKILKQPIKEHVMWEGEKSFVPVEEVVPAAVSVKALLVSSVDAVCGVYANSDPIPVKLRLLDDAHLPNGVTIKLKGCLLIASAFGNISNERVYMRLERLTQVNKQGEAVETEVVGYVSGEDGKFGLQGVVVDRSVKIVKNAAASGFLAGVGQTLQAAVSRQPVDSFNTYSVGTDIAQQGAVRGTSSAFDMLAEYYIRRAEQVQPVLQVNAGRIVDITFTHGFKRGDLNTKEKLKKIRSRSRGSS